MLGADGFRHPIGLRHRGQHKDTTRLEFEGLKDQTVAALENLSDLVPTTIYDVMTQLTTAQRDLLTAANGMVIYNTTTNKFQGYENGAWVNLV